MLDHSPTSEAPLFFVINAASGRQVSGSTEQAIDSAVRSAGRRYRIFIIESIDTLTATLQKAVDAAKEESGVVVAVGGDGTINAVAAVALASGCMFGAVPQGTFNYFGRTHGIPEDIESALDDLLHGQPVPVQVGLVNEHIFLVNASVGLYPELLEDREAFKQRYGRSRLVALWSAMVTALGDHQYLDMTLDQDGKRIYLRTTTLFIGNNRLQLEQVGIEQAESLKRGQLAAIAVNPVGTLAMLWLAARGALGKLGEAEHVTGFSFHTLTVVPRGLFRGKSAARRAERPDDKKPSRTHRIKVAADGEIMWLQAPLQFRVAPEPLMLIKRAREPGANDTKPQMQGDAE